MKKKLILVSLVAVLLVAGCGKKIPTLKNGEEAVAEFKNGNMISVNELYNELKQTSSLQVLLSMVDKQILEDKYKKNLDDAKKDAETSLKTIQEQYGEEALSTLQMYGYASFDAYKDMAYISYLQNLAINDYAKTLIDDKAIQNYYDNDVVGDIKLSQILITPNVKEGATDAEKTKAESDALKEANEIITQLNAAKKEDLAKTFEEIAKKSSDDQATSKNGGSMGYVNKKDLDTQYQNLGTESYKLKDGAISKTPFKTSLGYHILYRIESKAKPKLETVKDSIIESLTSDKVNNDPTTKINAMRELRKEYGFEIVDSELKTQYTNYIQNSLKSAQDQMNQNK